MTAAYVHGSTDSREIARLEKQAGFTASFTFSTLGIKAGDRVLDLATGVGAMGALLQRDFPEANVVGVDLSSTQLGAARHNHPRLPVLRGDATRLPFADKTFDRVHCSWLLEHVPRPLAVLEEVRRVLVPGGCCQFVEVDNATFVLSPESAAVTELLARLNSAQQRAGGDPFVGQQIERLLSAAKFERVDIVRRPLLGHEGDPVFFQAFIDEFAEIFEGLDESLGVEAAPLIATAITELRGHNRRPGATMHYTPVIFRAWRALE